MKRVTCLLVALLFTPSLLADDMPSLTFSSGPQQTQLLELYTSQGCSSCPPADAWLSRFRRDPDLWRNIVPVAFHVDYWDRLGWKDRFAQSAFSARQGRYQQAGNIRTVYTPAFVVNGKEWRGWFSDKKMEQHETTAGILAATVRHRQLSVRYTDYQASGAMVSHVALLGFGLETPIRAGENSSKTLQEDFVVLWHHSAVSDNGRWKMALPAKTEFDAPAFGLAVWVTQADSPAPLQATGSWF